LKKLHEIDKGALKRALIERLHQDLAVITAAQRASQAGVTHEESRAESDKDMRATETSYLARGQAERVVALREDIAKVDHMTIRNFGSEGAVALSALVRVEGETEDEIYFVAPAGGGIRLSFEALDVRVVTPDAPLGRILLGKRVDDVIERPGPQGVREQTVVELV
jgi:transcription elongation GreA/GreB family factor